jgi:uncharacterized protein (DUF305 family)
VEPTELDDATTDEVDGEDELIVLPWWRNPFTLGAFALLLLGIVGLLGYAIGKETSLDDPNGTDIGFLQDMRVHHEQAVEMAFLYLNDPGTEPALRTVASTIMLEQQLEIGRMIQLLRGFHESEVNETDLAMSWMGAPVPLDEMPGLAAAEDVDRLRLAEGADADRIFVELMIVHHEGGIHMAEHAAEHGGSGEVRRMATQIVAGQREEVNELRDLLQRAEGGD